MKKRVLKLWAVERFRRGLAAFLCASLVFTSSGLHSGLTGASAATEYDAATVYDVLLNAIGIKADGISASDIIILRSSFSDYFSEDTLSVFDAEIADAQASGSARISTSSMDSLLAWVESLYTAAGDSSISSLLGLDGKYEFTKEYQAVQKYDEEYGVLTPTNSFSEEDDGYELNGIWTFDLNEPVYKPVNCSSGTTALYSRESIEGAMLSFSWNEARTFDADLVQKIEASGSREVTPATKTEFGPEDYDGDLHVHTGNSLTGGGCYTQRGYHEHTDSCKTYKYAIDYDHSTEEDQRIMTVSVKRDSDGWLLSFRSDGNTDRADFMRLNTSTSATPGNYNWYIDYSGNTVPSQTPGTLHQNYKGYGNLADMFGGGSDNFITYLNQMANDIKQTGESTDSINFTKSIKWVDFYSECKSYMGTIGYEERWCPASISHEVYSCGMTIETVTGFSRGCGLESGKYYKGKTPVNPESNTVVTKAELLHPQQTLTAGNLIDTRVVLTYLDGHTETVNEKATIVSSKYDVTSNFSTASVGIPDGYVFPYKIAVSALFGTTVKDAKASGNTKKVLYLLASFKGDKNVFDNDVQDAEVIGKNEQIADATESKHTDDCYPGIKHVHDLNCIPAGAELHKHSNACRYTFTPEQEDLQVKIRKLASTIDVIYYSPTMMYKTCYRLEAGAGTALVTKASAAFDGKDIDNFSSIPFSTVINDDVCAFRSYNAFDQIRNGADREFAFDTFCNKVFDQFSEDAMTQTIYGISDTCFDASKTTLGSIIHEYACGMVSGGYYGDVFTCSKEAGNYYDASGVVPPICDKVVVSADLVYGSQIIYGQQHVCTDVRLTFLDGHVVIMNAAGSNDVATITTTYDETDVSHLGETMEYTVSVDCLYGNTALTATRQTLSLPLTVFTRCAEELLLAEKFQIIVQGETPDYSGIVKFADNSITTEHYRDLTAKFTNNLDTNATGEQIVRVDAILGDSIVSDTLNLWVIPAPSVFEVTMETPDVAAGTMPTYKLNLEYGNSSDAAYKCKEMTGITWDQLVEGIDLGLVHQYHGIEREFSQHAQITEIKNSASSLGETGTDYQTGGRYRLVVSMTGNAEKTVELEQAIHENCSKNDQHDDYYADSCPVCDYQESNRDVLDELLLEAAGIVNGLTARSETIKTSYDLTNYPASSVAERYKEQYNTAIKEYQNALDALESAADSIRKDSESLGSAFNEAVSIDSVEALINEFRDAIAVLKGEEKQEEFDDFVQQAAEAFQKIIGLVEDTDKIHASKLTMSIESDRLVEDTSETSMLKYTTDYNGSVVEFKVKGISDSGDSFDNEYLSDMKYRLEIANGLSGGYVPFDGEIKNAGNYYLKVIPDDGDYEEFINPLVWIEIKAIPLTAKDSYLVKEYDGTNVFSVDRIDLDGLLEADIGKVYADASKCTLVSADKNVCENSKLKVQGDLVVSGEAKDNYVISDIGMFGSIVARKVTTYPVGKKVYDGLLSMDVDFAPLAGVVTGESISLDLSNVSAALVNNGAGDHKEISMKGTPSLIGDTSKNYSLEIKESQVIVIPKELVYTISSGDREYDGTTSVSIKLGKLSGAIEGDDVSFSTDTISGSIASADVGEYSPIFLDQPSLTGKDAENYNAKKLSISTVRIKPRMLAYSKDARKEYDGNTLATIQVSELEGIVDSENVFLSSNQLLGDFDSKDAGKRIVTPLQPLSLTGADASNYSIESLQPFHSTIDKRTLTCVYTPLNKVFNGNTNVSIKVSDLTGVLAGEDVSLQSEVIQGTLESAGYGSNVRVISCAAVKLAGADASNYTVAESATELFTDVTDAVFTVSGVAESREYNGQCSVMVNLSPLSGIDPDIDVSLAEDSVVGTIDTKDAGIGKLVNVADIKLVGDDADKCSIQLAEPVLVDIHPKMLYATAKGVHKVYDGTTAGQIAITGLSGLIADDDVSFEKQIVSGLYKTSDAAPLAELTPVEQPVLFGADSKNYVLSDLTGTFISAIEKRPIFVSAKDAGPFTCGELSDEKLKALIDVEYLNVLPEEYDTVRIAMTPPELRGVSSAKTGTFSIDFDPYSGDPTANYEFNFSKNLGVYTVVDPEGYTKVTIHTVYESWYVDAIVDGEISHLQTDQNGDVDVYVKNPGSSITIRPLRPVHTGDDESEKKTVTINTGMPNAVVDVTINGETVKVETDDSGNLTIKVPANESVTVTVEKTGTVDGKDPEEPPIGTVHKYHVGQDGSITDVIEVEGTVTLGKDENGNLYWEDEDGNRRPINGISIGPNEPIPDKIVIDNGYDGEININDVDVSSPDGPYVEVINGNPTITLDGDNKIVVPDGVAGIHVTTGSSITIGPKDGIGSIDITHVDESGKRVQPASASGIGGNTEESSGNIRVEGGIITGDDLGNSPNYVPVENDGGCSVIISGGNVDVNVNADSVTDADGKQLHKAVIDISAINERNTVFINHCGEKDGAYQKVRPIQDRVTVWIVDCIDTIWLRDANSILYKATFSQDKGLWIAKKSSPDEQIFKVDSNGNVLDVIEGKGTVTITKDDNGNPVWIDDDGTHLIEGNGVVLNKNTTADKFVVDGYNGKIMLDEIDARSEDGSYVDIVSGNLTIDLEGDNKITVPDGFAGIHVGLDSTVTIEGSGSITVIHLDKDGNVVSKPTAAGIGGNTGEGSGQIIMNGGTIHGGTIGAAPGADNSDTKVVIISGVINTPVNAGTILDGSGTELRQVMIDASAALNKGNVTATRQNVQDGVYYKVTVDSNNIFSHFVQVDAKIIYCYSDSKLYRVDLTENNPKMVEVNGSNVSNGNNSSNNSSGGSSSGSGYRPGSSSNNWGSSGIFVPPVTSNNPSESVKPSDPLTPDMSQSSENERPDKDSASESAIESTLPWLINSILGNKNVLKLIDDKIILINSRVLQFNENAEISLNGQDYSNRLEFPEDGQFLTVLYLYDKFTQTLVVLRGITIVVDTTGPVIKIANEQSAFLVTKSQKNVRTYSVKTAEIAFKATDSLSGIKSVQYKLVRVGQGLRNVKWKSYKNGSKIKVSNSGAYRIYVRAYDVAGNKRYVKTNSFCVDKDKPTVNVKNLRSYEKGIVLKAKDSCGVKRMILDKKRIKNYTAVKQIGWHRLVITDKVGHKRTVIFRVKK